MRPDVTDSSPATMRSAVVLPQPDGPSSTRNSPSSMVRSRPLTTCTAPKDLKISESVTSIELTLHGTDEESARDVLLKEAGDDHDRCDHHDD